MQHNYIPPPDTGLDILYQDEYILALNKPTGLLSVPGNTEQKKDSLAIRVQKQFPNALTVHRLDMCTSGIILMALGKESHRQLNKMFEQRKIQKRYLAVIDGIPDHATGEINLPLITDWPNRPRQKIDHEAGKPSCTRYKVLLADARTNSTRIGLEPITGRTHQLRVHMQALGHTILGDGLYGGKIIQEKSKRLLLHASLLEFVHPFTEQHIKIENAPPF